MKRYRKPKLKDGELRRYYGKLEHGSPDVLFAWQCDTSRRRDSSMLYHMLGSQRPDPRAQPLFSKMLPSFLEELESRGYDLTTIKFSIMKKAKTTGEQE